MPPILIALDRDNTLIAGRKYLGKYHGYLEQIEFLPGAVEGLRALNSLPESTLVVATNQAGVARGFFGLDIVGRIHAEIDRRLIAQGVRIDGWYVCPYVDLTYARRHGLDPVSNPFVRTDHDPKLALRKPGIGMILEAAQDRGKRLEDYLRVYCIGDTVEDEMMGVNAGKNGRGIRITNASAAACEDHAPMQAGNRIVLPDLYEAAQWIALDLQA